MSTQDLTAQQAATSTPPPAPPVAPRQGGRRKGQSGTTMWFWVFVGPFVLGMAIFGYLPIAWSLVLSLFEAQNTVVPQAFVGIQNYVDMFTDAEFLDSLWTFTLFAIFIVPLTFASSLALALLVHQIPFMQAFFRSVFFLPTACSYVVASLVWKQSIFNGTGLANTILGWFGVEQIAWFSQADPPWFWLGIVSVRLWLQCGFYMILFLAGLQRIPTELYEAAYVDGAKPGWKTFRYITLPQLRTTSVAILILILIAAYQAFDEFFNLLGNTTFARPPLVYLYYTSLGNQDYGHGSAGSWILALLIAIVTIIQGRAFGLGKRKD